MHTQWGEYVEGKSRAAMGELWGHGSRCQHGSWSAQVLGRMPDQQQHVVSSSSSSSLLWRSGCIDADHTRGVLAQNGIQGQAGLARPLGACEQQALAPRQRGQCVHRLCA